MPKTNQEIQNEIEAKLAEMSPEEREATLAADEAMDRLMCIKLSRELDAHIETIPGDRHHIKVNGEVMGYNEYARWAEARYAELHPYDDDDDDYHEDDDEEDGMGFFSA